MLQAPDGFGEEFQAVCQKWAKARATDDANVERTFLALMDEVA